MNEVIEKVDFQNLEKYKYGKYIPAVMTFTDIVLKIETWAEMVKLFFYFAFKNNDSRALIIEANQHYQYDNPLSNNTCNSPFQFGEKTIKFAPTWYVRLNTDNTTIFTIERYTDNLNLCGYILKNSNFPNFELYVANNSVDKEKLNIEKKTIIKHLTSKKCAVTRKEKNVKTVISMINCEIFSPLEKLNIKVGKQFNKKTLLGDIDLSEEELTELTKYMASDLQRLNRSSYFKPYYPQLFALGLVRFAMKHYGQKTFWPYFRDEYGVNIDVNKQGELHDTFRSIMRSSGKKYDEDVSIKIDNISLHSFVTDKCAPQLFNYLFDFWRIDLNRNIDNMYGENGRKVFKMLLDELSQTRQNISDVMKHTSLAIIHNKKSCILRIRRILYFIDECYWNQTEVPITGNRINQLLNKWMSNPRGEFQKAYQQKQRLHTFRGESLFSNPTLCVDYAKNTFSIKLPRQILKGCTEDEYPKWVIEFQNEIKDEITPDLVCGKIAFQTEECAIELAREHIFGKIKLTLLSSLRKYATFQIKSSEYRFFNDKGEIVQCDNKYISCGNITCFSRLSEFPKVLYGEELTVFSYEKLHICQYNLVRGDILLFPNQIAIQAGEKLQDGLVGNHPLSDVLVKDNNSKIEVYNKLPKILFKATREQLTGTGLFVKKGNSEKRFKVLDKKYYEFKLDDTLDDIYAYVVDLNDFEIDEGIQHFWLDIPRGKWTYNYKICYLKDLDYEFVGAPYVFSEWGKIKFSKDTPILIDNDNWEQSENSNNLFFIFDKSNKDCSEKVEDCYLNLNYSLFKEKLNLSFKIPALFWKYEKDGEWSSNSPADILLKNIPSHMYVKGPFGFVGKRSYLELDETSLSEETRIPIQKVSGQDYYEIPLSQMKSWLNHNMESCRVSLVLDGYKHHLFNVICRSKILSQAIYGDFEEGLVYGKFDIQGNEEYIVSIRRGDLTLAEVPLINGQFKFEAHVEEGKYEVTVFELEDSDDGFDDVSSFVIGKFELDIIDKFNLVDKSIKITAIQDRNKKFKPVELFAQHIITDLKRIGDYDNFSLLNRDILGLRGEIDLEECLYYTGILRAYVAGKETTTFDVLVVFYDKTDISKVGILRYVTDEKYSEYQELFYSAFSRTLIEREEDAGKNKFSIKQNLRILYDDEYEVSIEIVK